MKANRIKDRLRIPVVAAPMFLVSGPDLVIAACASGIVGAFPTANCRTVDELDQWLTRIRAGLAPHGPDAAPFCPNLIMRQPSLHDDLACLLRHCPEMVITSVGSPKPVIRPLQDIGCQVFADVASIRHAERAIEAGCDGLVLLTAGAGGQTGWLNPFAFVRRVRQMFDGQIILAGGMSDGWSVWSAIVLGCDLVYMGTKFIATQESQADPLYKSMLVDGDCDDIVLTRTVTGLPSSILIPSLTRAGITLDDLAEIEREDHAPDDLRSAFDRASREAGGARRWKDVWSAGHSVGGVINVPTVADLVSQTEAELRAAQAAAPRRS